MFVFWCCVDDHTVRNVLEVVSNGWPIMKNHCGYDRLVGHDTVYTNHSTFATIVDALLPCCCEKVLSLWWYLVESVPIQDWNVPNVAHGSNWDAT